MADLMVPFGSREYWLLVTALVFSRGMDFLSTWIATPNLVLEANPIARKLGWRGGLVLNTAICFSFAFWPLPSLIIATTSLLVAARNLQSAWLMRAVGEQQYRDWMGERLATSSRPLYFFCLLGQTLFYGLIGATLLWFSRLQIVPVGIGTGLIAYAAAVLVYSSLSVWRLASRRV